MATTATTTMSSIKVKPRCIDEALLYFMNIPWIPTIFN
ncbi:hypothetical protein CAter282_3626 [Collimonas arenae]|uniref:Uncharacterized protein n=1 Tax=Collimonas arenae TaxID=279058 RepID=A0A127QMM1_9BURK|nr:hypothetical protein CAter10_3967 [Collimonas arenae]AMP11308.1 hypothetical protein CAter282_3626 [Collimonas arenae]